MSSHGEAHEGGGLPGGEIITAIKWIAEHSSEPKGTATLTSATASWKQEGVHEGAVNATHPALLVRGYHLNDPHTPESEGFRVMIGVQGSFRTNPPEIDGARFLIEEAHCGDGTNLDLKFTPYSDNALERGGVWVVPFYCDGKFQIRHDVTVTFSSVMYVDTGGTIHLENPQITSDRSGESQMHARWSIHWDNNTLWKWDAAFETRDGLPFLGVAFTFLHETEFS